ncbi:MAG: hypothetical protein ACUVX9_12755 [Anaerolineae bacterium]
MVDITLRLPVALYDMVSRMAQADQVSVDSFIIRALIEKVAAVRAMEHLRSSTGLSKHRADTPASPIAYDGSPADPEGE